jgi:DNA-binding transcriptional regulator GbsR (MarR family)
MLAKRLLDELWHMIEEVRRNCPQKNDSEKKTKKITKPHQKVKKSRKETKKPLRLANVS